MFKHIFHSINLFSDRIFNMNISINSHNNLQTSKSNLRMINNENLLHQWEEDNFKDADEFKILGEVITISMAGCPPCNDLKSYMTRNFTALQEYMKRTSKYVYMRTILYYMASIKSIALINTNRVLLNDKRIFSNQQRSGFLTLQERNMKNIAINMKDSLTTISQTLNHKILETILLTTRDIVIDEISLDKSCWKYDHVILSNSYAALNMENINIQNIISTLELLSAKTNDLCKYIDNYLSLIRIINESTNLSHHETNIIIQIIIFTYGYGLFQDVINIMDDNIRLSYSTVQREKIDITHYDEYGNMKMLFPHTLFRIKSNKMGFIHNYGYDNLWNILQNNNDSVYIKYNKFNMSKDLRQSVQPEIIYWMDSNFFEHHFCRFFEEQLYGLADVYLQNITHGVNIEKILKKINK